MESTDAILTYRYPGVKPFTTEEQSLFFGRDNDINDLFSLIFVKQAVVLYGKSGYGKSSLINAGIIPRLQTETRFVYFPIRFNNYSEKEQAGAVSPTETVRSRVGETGVNSPLDALIPHENSFWYWLKTYQWHHQQTQFILFFDQFEELFTYPKAQIDEFSEQLAQLLYPAIPLQFRQRMVDLDGTDALNDELDDFLYQKPDIKVVFAVRSDRLALLNTITDRHPAILQNCYELDALDRDQAREAIINPAQKADAGYLSPTFQYTPDAVEKILDNIADPQDGKIESATLQIVCRYVEEELVAHRTNVTISRQELGDITDIFQKYYEGILNRLTEADRQKAQQLIEDELIASGRRNPLSEAYIQTKFGISPELLSQLEATSLLRKERDANGRLLYEVSHDTLVGAIEKVAIARRSIEEEDKRKELEQEVADERAKAEYLQKLTKQAQDNERKAKSRSKVAWVVVAFAAIIAGLAYFFYLGAKEATQKAKALYWASESDKLIPDQALRLLEEAAQYNLDSPIYERIVRLFNNGDYDRFMAKILPHQALILSAQFAPDGNRIVTASQDMTAKVWDLTGKQLATLPHQDHVLSAQFAPDGNRIVTASKDGTAKVWDLTGKLLVTLPHQAPVISAQFAPDGNRIVTASRDMTAKVWDLTGKLLATLPHQDLILSAQFAPDGNRIVTASQDMTAKVWDLTGKLLATLPHQALVRSAQFAPDGNRIVTASKDGTAKVWDLTGKLLATLPHQAPVNLAQFAPDGNRIVTASGDSTAKVWGLTGKLLATLPHQEFVLSAQFAPDGNRIVTASGDSTAKVWDLSSKRLATLTHQVFVTSAQFAPDGNRIVTTSYDSTAKVWNLSGQLLTTLTHQNYLPSAQFAPDGNRIVTASGDSTAKVWDLTGKLLATLPHQAPVNLAQFAPDGNRVVTASEDSTAKVWDLSGKLLATLPHQTPVISAQFAPDGNRIVTTSYDKTAKVWDLSDKRLATLTYQDAVTSAQFAPDGNRIVTASWDGTAKVWDLTGKLLATLPHQGTIRSAQFAPDGNRIVTASEDSTAKVWDLSGKLLATLPYQTAVTSAQFAPDGQRIVTTSWDNTAKVWDLSGQLLAILTHQGEVLSAQFTPDGQRIVTASEDNAAKVWDLKGTLLATLTHQDAVTSAQFAPDGNRIVTASRDNTAKVWYTAEGVLQWLKENNDKVPPLSEENRKKYGVDD